MGVRTLLTELRNLVGGKTFEVWEEANGDIKTYQNGNSLVEGVLDPVTEGSSFTDGSATLKLPAGVTDLTAGVATTIYPTPTNNQWAIIGDSRTASSTENSNTYSADRLTAYGYANWAQHASNYRGKFVGNFGINSQTLSQIQSRISPAATATSTAGTITTTAGVATFTDTTHGTGSFAVGQQLFGTDVLQGTYITALGTGTGANAGGTYIVNPAQNVTSTAISGYGQRANVLGSTASVFVLLGGVNDGTNPVATDGPVYQQIIAALVAAGKIVIVMNELPNSNSSNLGSYNLARRTFLDVAAYTPYSGSVIKFNSYDLMAQSPTSYLFKAGYINVADALHPNFTGNRALGIGIGAILDGIFAAGGYPARNGLPAYVADTAFAGVNMFSGTSGTKGTGATGSLATGWTGPSVPAGYAIDYSKDVDSDGFDQQVITITGTAGTVGAIVSVTLNNFNFAGTIGVSGDVVQHVARCIVDAGNTGLVGLGVVISASDTTNNVVQNAASFSGSLFNSSLMDDGWMGIAFDGNILSQPVTLRSGGTIDWTTSVTKSIQPSFALAFLGGSPVNVTVRLSRCGIVKNI